MNTIPWRTIAIAVAAIVIASLVGYHRYAVYQSHQDGIKSGYEQGKQATIAVYQPEIDKFNLERMERNLIIEALKKSAVGHIQRIEELETRGPEIVEKTTIKYVQAHPQDALKCGITPLAAESYNEFLEQVLP